MIASPSYLSCSYAKIRQQSLKIEIIVTIGYIFFEKLWENVNYSGA